VFEGSGRLSSVAAKLAARFTADQSGNIAVLFGLTLMPMVVVGGAAIDYSRASGARSAMQSALDSGVVAAATQSNGLTVTQLSQTVATFFDSNKGSHPIKNLQITVTTPDAQTVAATATACIDHVFKGVLGSAETCFAADAEAKRGKNHLEVALVLDNTGSMTANDRIVHLRNAAKLLVDRLEAASKTSTTRTVKVSLVPFVTAVNIKGEGFNNAWMDTNAENPLHGANFDPPTGSPVGTRVNHFTLFNNFKATWKGCVEARPAPYNLDDTPPTPGNGSTLFVPYFAPDDPGTAAAAGNSGSAYNNSYLNEPSSGTETQKLRSTGKYLFPNEAARPVAIVENAPNLSSSENRTNGPNRACPTPILPLSGDFNKVRTNIAAMRHWNGSGTNVSEGLAWGWRVLSPDPPYTEGRSFNDPSVQKVVVLLTDGENVVYGANFGGSLTRSDYGSYGFMTGGRFGSQDQTTAARNVDGWTQSLCTSLKSRGVLIYALTLEADTVANRSLYGQCASRPDTYMTSNSASQLSTVFNNIAEQLIALKLTK
jgi:Flp pilus assembly protein TadG